MKKIALLFVSITFHLISFSQDTIKSELDSSKVSNLLPMYGNAEKSEVLKKADDEFINQTLKKFNNDYTKASLHYSSVAWKYFEDKDFKTAMKRFNQAWLLDKNNFNSYWGFGVILGLENKYRESIPHFLKSIELNPNEPNIYVGVASSYFKLFFEDNDIENIYKSINYLLINLKLNPNYVPSLAQLTGLYYIIEDENKALEYYKKSIELDPNSIPKDLKKELEKIKKK